MKDTENMITIVSIFYPNIGNEELIPKKKKQRLSQNFIERPQDKFADSNLYQPNGWNIYLDIHQDYNQRLQDQRPSWTCTSQTRVQTLGNNVW